MTRVVFMGTPEFAVPSLEALLDGGWDIAAVCTQPDRPSGRGHRLTACPVKEAALRHGLEVLQFERIHRQEGLDALRALRADLFVTAAFGQILSQKILDIPPMGTVNVHASLLPRYRGAAPIAWCIMEGERETGVTTMLTDRGVDTGDMLLRRRTDILPGETAGELSERLSRLGAALLAETLRRLEAGDCPREKQDEAQASHFPMLDKSHGRIRWTQSALRADCQVRGVTPWPGAWTVLPDGGILKIWKARPVPGAGRPGEVLRADARAGMAVACAEGALELVEVQGPGGRRMPAADYLRGHPLPAGLCLDGEASQ